MKSAFLNGKIYVKFSPLTLVEAIVVEDGKIIFAGKNEEAKKIADDIIDLNNKTVIPGFIDAHMHLDELGAYLNILDLRGTRSIEELRRKLAEFAKTHEGPIMGHGWDQEMFREGRWPEKGDIDDIVNDRPVILTRVCIHAALVNDYFLKLMNYRSETGIVKEKDFEMFRHKFNSLISAELKKKYISDAMDELEKNGITSIGFVSCSKEIFDILRELDMQGKIHLRINVYINPEDFDSALNFVDTEHLRFRGMKLFVDGSLGARTALLSESYSDEDTNGVQVFDNDFLMKNIEKCVQNGKQVAIHAIGDRAMDIAISLLKNFPGNRIEHCSMVRDDQLEKLKGINMVVQPHFIITDYWVLQRVGDQRAKFVYRLRDLMNAGNVAFSTDSPVEPINPFSTNYAAITRGEHENVPISRFRDQRLNVAEALHCYTSGSAKAIQDDRVGSLEPGKFADFIILNKDPMKCNDLEIEKIKVMNVYISGNPVV